MSNKYDKILGEYREKDVTPTRSTTSIPQYSTDPSSPVAQDVWVLKTQSAGTGGGKLNAFLGLGFPYLTPGVGSSLTYQLSYRTQEGTTKRVTIS